MVIYAAGALLIGTIFFVAFNVINRRNLENHNSQRSNRGESKSVSRVPEMDALGYIGIALIGLGSGITLFMSSNLVVLCIGLAAFFAYAMYLLWMAKQNRGGQ